MGRKLYEGINVRGTATLRCADARVLAWRLKMHLSVESVYFMVPPTFLDEASGKAKHRFSVAKQRCVSSRHGLRTQSTTQNA